MKTAIWRVTLIILAVGFVGFLLGKLDPSGILSLLIGLISGYVLAPWAFEDL